jgi:phosphoheptose isomerase
MVIVGGDSRQPDLLLTPELGRLEEVAAEEGVLQKVAFTGHRARHELKYYYSAADVFISTPWYEPFGITPVEAMGCGTPVIGANVGGIKYTVVDEETGYLVPPNDPQAIADRLKDLYRNPQKQKRFSQQAIRRVNEVFTWQNVAHLMSVLYREILAEKRPEEFTFSGLQEGSQPDPDEDTLHVIAQTIDSALETLQRSRRAIEKGALQASQAVINCLARGGKVLICGNGGSAAEAQHFASELVGRFSSADRRGLPVLALTADSAFLTAWSNDVGYEKVFSRQVEALGRQGDLLIGISTSGRSQNLYEAFTVAHEMDIETFAILGGDGGDLFSISDVAVVVPSWNTQRIQEIQKMILHLLCELVERHIENTTWVHRRNLVFSVAEDRRPNG